MGNQKSKFTIQLYLWIVLLDEWVFSFHIDRTLGHQQSFSYKGMGLLGLNQYSRTQHSDASETRT